MSKDQNEHRPLLFPAQFGITTLMVSYKTATDCLASRKRERAVFIKRNIPRATSSTPYDYRRKETGEPFNA